MFKMLGDIIKLVTNWAVFVEYVKAAVIAAESDTSATGEQKRDAVIKAVINGAKNDFGIDLTGFTNVIEMIVNLIVDVLNDLGVFKHASKETVSVTH